MQSLTELNKEIVKRFNKECLEEGNLTSFKEILSESVINHSAPSGMPNGPESFYHFINEILRKGFSDIKVEILEQVAENNFVTTRKKILGNHTGEIFGIKPTNKSVAIDVIDIIRLENGKYVEHWGQSNLSDTIQKLSVA